MSGKVCCLCCTSGISEYECLQNDSGECNEIYEITVKYFDPMLLTVRSGESNVLCQNCWIHIRDFNDFHEKIIKTTTLEYINIEKLPLHIKEEDGKANPPKNVANNNTGNKELVQTNEVLLNDNLEDQNKFKKNVIFSSDDDEVPFNNLRISKETFSLEVDTKICSKEKKLYQKEKRTIRKTRKANISFGASDCVNLQTKNTKLKQSVKDSDFHPVLEKGKEYDNFIAEWKSQLECDLCSQKFPLFDMLKVHFKESHNAKGYVKCCDRRFDRRCSLVEHIRLHINPEIHKCNICGKLSSSKYNLKLHKKFIHEESEQFECNVCPRTFKQKQNLESHMLTHVTGNKDFKCTECGKAYVLEFQLKKHIKLVHIDNRICDQCGKTLNSLGALKNHLKEHSGIEKPKYPCDECGTVLKSNSSLKGHKASYHSDGSTVYICSICGKVSATERGLKNHRKYVHEIERKHKCPYCDKGFKRPKNLQEHIATHTGESLYQCPLCPRSFKMYTKNHEHLKKVHPIEWEESRKNRLEKQKIDYERITNQVVI